MSTITRSVSKKRTADNQPEGNNSSKLPKMASESDIEKLLSTLQRIETKLIDTNNKIDGNTLAINEKAMSLEKKIEDSYIKVKEEFQSELKKLNENIDSNIKTQITQIESKLEKNTQKLNEEINSIRQQINESSKPSVSSVNNDFDRLMLINDLKVVGIPYRDDENLHDVFTKIAAIIGYDTTNPTSIPYMRRIITRSQTSNQNAFSKIITLKFIAIHIKEHFYGLYLNTIKNKPLSLKDIGLTIDSRIIISEQ